MQNVNVVQGPESLCTVSPPPSYRWMGGQAAAERWRIGVGTGRQLLLVSQLMSVANDNPFSFTVKLADCTCSPPPLLVPAATVQTDSDSDAARAPPDYLTSRPVVLAVQIESGHCLLRCIFAGRRHDGTCAAGSCRAASALGGRHGEARCCDADVPLLPVPQAAGRERVGASRRHVLVRALSRLAGSSTSTLKASKECFEWCFCCDIEAAVVRPDLASARVAFHNNQAVKA